MPPEADDRFLKSAERWRPPPTEAANPASQGIDAKRTEEILEVIHSEDRKAWEAVGRALPAIARVVDAIVTAFRSGGRLIYLGAGTSGRLGVLDASECLPTFGAGPERVSGIIAGGDAALRLPIEGAEDSPGAGAEALRRSGVRACDVVCGIAASGRTPFVWGALEEASLRDATTVLITCNSEWSAHPRAGLVDLAIEIPVGPEVIAGSTRMKAGTATKLVLNSLSTAAMIRWGKVYDNLMVDLTPTNEKLRGRAVGLVARLASVPTVRAAQLLGTAGGEVKTAIVSEKLGVDPAQARAILARHGGQLRAALEAGAGSALTPPEPEKPKNPLDSPPVAE